MTLQCSRTSVVRATLLAMTALAMAACGAPAPKSKAPLEVGIFTSAQDCAAKQKLSREECAKLIQKAIDLHYAKSKTYIAERPCELAEGLNRCERVAEKEYRPRLAAFLITFSTPAVSEPLYGPKDKTTIGFATLGNAKTFLAVDEALIITASAKAIAEGFVAAKRR